MAPDALYVAGDPEIRVADHYCVHPLLSAVHVAFAEHRPIALSPDAIWLTIAQGVAHHARLNADRLRPRLLRQPRRRTLELVLDGPLASDAGGIDLVIGAYRDALAQVLGSGVARLMRCDFSTTTRIEHIASDLVLSDVCAPYFDRKLSCECGIPEVTLLGTPADWRSIRERIDVVTELDLGFWRPSLGWIVDELIATSEGRPNREFWRRIYQPRQSFGVQRITGWIGRMYPYLVDEVRPTGKNPLLDQPFDFDPPEDPRKWYDGPGVATRDVPAWLSRVLIDVRDQTGAESERFTLCLEGGLTHVECDRRGCLIPRAGYLVRRPPASIHCVIDRIRSEHTSVRAQAPCQALGLPPDLVALHDAFAAASLFGAPESPVAWRLRPLECSRDRPHPTNVIARKHPGILQQSFVPVFDLPDGTLIVWAYSGLYARIPAQAVQHEAGKSFTRLFDTETPVVARSVSELLSAALDAGPGFDPPSLGMLSELEDYVR